MKSMSKKVFQYLVMAVTVTLFSTASFAEFYKWTDENGVVQFSNDQPDQKSVEEIEIRVNTYKGINYDESVVDSSPLKTNRSKKVIMYGASWCGYCAKARRYFKSNNIKFTEYDIEKNRKAKARYDKLGARGIPVIFVGKKRMNGFSVDSFKRIYN